MKKRIFYSIICVVNSIHTQQLSFEHLFPMSWYEKGLSSVIAAEHALAPMYKSAIPHKTMESVLGKCAFAHFCLKKMRNTGQNVLEEDVSYFSCLLNELELFLTPVLRASRSLGKEYNDHVECIKDTIDSMKNYLKVPSDINTK